MVDRNSGTSERVARDYVISGQKIAGLAQFCE